MQFAGELGVANFASVDTDGREEFLKLDSLTLNGLDLRYQPHGLDIASVNVVGLRGNLVILPDKSSNWKGMVNNAEKLQELIVKLQLNKLFPFQIGTVSFENGSFGFTDRSIEPHVVSEIQDVAGSVTGLSSTEQGDRERGTARERWMTTRRSQSRARSTRWRTIRKSILFLR